MAYWAKTYGGGEAKAVAVDKNGDIIVAGYVKGIGAGKKDGFVMRLDEDGNVKWFKTYGGAKDDVFNDVKIAENGDIIVAGWTDSFGAGGRDVWVLRLDGNGNVKWQKTYGGSDDDRAEAVAVAPNGDILVAGYTSSFSVGGRDVWVLRLEDNGNVIWQKTYGGAKEDAAYALVLTPNGDIIVAGYTYSFGAGGRDVWVLRLDSKGNVKWQKTYGGSDWDMAYALAIAPNGDIIVAGESESFSAGDYDVWVLRLDSNGNVKWQKTYGGNNASGAYALAIAPNGDIIVAGAYRAVWTNSILEKGDVWVLRLDSKGNVKWQKTYGGSDWDMAYALAIAPNGDIIVAGESESFSAGDYDVWVLRLPPNGELEGFSKDSEGLVKDSNAPITESNAQVSEGYAEKEVEEEKEIWENVGRIFKKKIKKTSKVKKKIKILPQYLPSNATVRPVWVKVGVIYNPSNLKIIEFWRHLSAGQFKKAAELFEALYPEVAGALIKFFVPIFFVLEEKYENAESAEVLLGVSNPYLSRLKVEIKLRNDEDFTPERDSFRFTLKKGESFVKRINTTRAKDHKGEYWEWHYFGAVFEFPEYGVKVDKDLSLTDKGEMVYVLVMLETNLSKKLELLRKAASLGHEEAKEELEKLEKQLESLKQNIQNSLSFTTPQLIEGANSIIKLTAKNDFAKSLKLILDLSENDFFELETSSLKFPTLRKGKKVSKNLAVTPKYAGSFDFRVKIKAVADGIEVETEKTIPVEVVERTVTPATPVTPQPATPSTPSPAYLSITAFPSELLAFYEPIEELGRGGFARVYKAKCKRNGEIVAVKIPLNPDPATGKSFLREIENWTKLKHPNIVRVYDYNILPVPFFEMEFCEGSLEKLPKPTGVRSATLFIFNIAEGLKYAHSRGIIHRDLKPSNILLKSGIPKISDWGLSKVIGKSGTTTTSFTALYAAPEQFSKSRFGSTDERTDIYQLGVIFYQLVTGRLPFESDDPFELMFMIMNEEPVKPSELNPEAKEIEPIILRMLAKHKEDRYESAAELQSDLASYLGIELRRELKRSRTMGDKRLIVYYLGNLLVMSVKMGNLTGAYKYASDFTMLTSGELKQEFEMLAEQFKLRLEEGLEIPTELIEKTDILVHKVMVRIR